MNDKANWKKKGGGAQRGIRREREKERKRERESFLSVVLTLQEGEVGAGFPPLAHFSSHRFSVLSPATASGVESPFALLLTSSGPHHAEAQCVCVCVCVCARIWHKLVQTW